MASPLLFLISFLAASATGLLEHGSPYTIAHRGCSGEFPESSAPAFKRAIEEGIDFLETDILSTQDGVLICTHDLTLDDITDVGNRTEFSHKKATYDVGGGVMVTGFFGVDFTWQEIQTLRVHQRFSFRDNTNNGLHRILSFEDFITIALMANRVVGIDPEIKSPAFVNEHVKWKDGIFEDKFISTLLKHGYNGSYLSQNWLRQPLFIQTFSADSIVHIANQTQSPKVFNIGDLKYATDEYFDFMKQFVMAVSMDKNMLLPMEPNSRRLLQATDMVLRAHAKGLQVHPATFRNEGTFMSTDFLGDPYREIDTFVRKLQVNAIMVDYPATSSSYMRAFLSGNIFWD